jgi:hypothetical protein
MLIRALLCLILPAAGLSLAQPAGTFADPQGRFSLAVPAGWKAAPRNADAVQLSSGGAYVTAMVLSGADPNLFIDAIGKQAGGQWRGFAQARGGETRLAGRAGVYAVYAGTNPAGVPAYLELMAAPDQGRTFLLMISAPQADFARLKPAFDQIERSLRIDASTATASPPAAPMPAGTGMPRAVAPPVPPAPPTPRAAPVPPSPPTPATRPAAGSGANYYRMKPASVVDEHGFEQPMRALGLLIPADWQFQGNVQYSRSFGCPADLAQVAFRASSPDGRIGLEMFPATHWQWSDDPNSVQMLQASNRQMASFGGKGCDVDPPLSAADFLRRVIVPHYRANAQVGASEPLPEMARQVSDRAREQEAAAARMGMQVRMRADVARVRIEYQNSEEWLTAVTFASGVPGPSFNIRTGQMGQTLYYSCGAYVLFGMRAPRGQLASMERFFNMVLSTVHMDPAWENRVGQVILKMQADNSRAAQQRSAIIAQNGRDINDMIVHGYEERSRIHDSAVAQFDQYIRGVQTFQNPVTGEKVELSNEYGRAWANGTGEYVLSDSAGFNPNAVLQGRWTELQPSKP